MKRTGRGVDHEVGGMVKLSTKFGDLSDTSAAEHAYLKKYARRQPFSSYLADTRPTLKMSLNHFRMKPATQAHLLRMTTSINIQQHINMIEFVYK